MTGTILYDMKKGTPAYQEQEDGSAKPTIIPYEKPMPEIDINTILVPAKKMLPNWYKKLDKGEHFEYDQTLTVKTCTSFITLFQNSYCFVTPIDFKINVERLGWDVEYDKKDYHAQYINFTSHTNSKMKETIEMGGMQENQLGPYWDKNYINIKMETAINIKSKKGRVDFVMMDAFWWIPDSPLQAMQGVLPVLDNYDTSLNINLWIRKDKTKTVTIKKGTPLGVLYSPTGKVEFKKTKIDSVLTKIGMYPVEARKCPYAYTLKDESNR